MSAEYFVLELQNQITATTARHAGALARLEALLLHDHPGRASSRTTASWRYPGDGNRLARRTAAKGRAR